MFVYGQMGNSGAFVFGFATGETYKVDSEFILISCFYDNKAQFSESGLKKHSGQFFFLPYLD